MAANRKLKKLMQSKGPWEKPQRKKAVKSYYGGDISPKQKAAHEAMLAMILNEAEIGPPKNMMIHFREFVKYAGTQRKPYATGNHKIDQRFLSAIGLAGEAGEINNMVKKIMFRAKVGSRKLPAEWREKLVSELGDGFWYFMLVLIAFDIEFDEVVMGNMRKLVKRGR